MGEQGKEEGAVTVGGYIQNPPCSSQESRGLLQKYPQKRKVERPFPLQTRVHIPAWVLRFCPELLVKGGFKGGACRWTGLLATEVCPPPGTTQLTACGSHVPMVSSGYLRSLAKTTLVSWSV